MTKQEIKSLEMLHTLLLDIKENLDEENTLCKDEDGGYTQCYAYPLQAF